MEAPALLADLAAAAVRGLEVEAGPPPPAVACALGLLSIALPRAWASFSPPALAAASRAAAASLVRRPDGSPSPALAALAPAAWLRRWAATPRLAGPLWEALGTEQMALHARAVVEGRHDAGLAGSATLGAAALGGRAGRSLLPDPPAAALALARLCGSGGEGSDAACAGLTALVAGGGSLPAAAVAALVEGGAAAEPVLTALGRTPAGADALLRAAGGCVGGEATPWPLREAAPLPPAVAVAVRGDPLGAVHLDPASTPGMLAAAAASRAGPGLVQA